MKTTELNEIVGRFLSHNLTLAFAESCTAGLLASEFVEAKGVSDVLLGSVVTYSPEAKQLLLGVKKQTLKLYTAESQQVTNEMVMGLHKLLKADMSVAVTGLCGSGGSENHEKPVGTIFVSIYFNERIEEYRENFDGGCRDVRQQAVDFIFRKMGDTIERASSHGAI